MGSTADFEVFDPVHGVIHHFYQDHLAAHEGTGPKKRVVHTDEWMDGWDLHPRIRPLKRDYFNP